MKTLLLLAAAMLAFQGLALAEDITAPTTPLPVDSSQPASSAETASLVS